MAPRTARATAAWKVELVEAMPRRRAHALHALLEATRESRMPSTAAEVMLYDSEAISPRSTAAALRGAGPTLAACAGGYWVAGNSAQELRTALEDRFLRETNGTE